MIQIDNKQKIVMVHIFTDSQFFDSVSDYFDSFECLENRYYFVGKKNYKFTYIKHTHKVVIVEDKDEYLSLLNATDVDIVYLQSLKYIWWDILPKIRQSVKVIWWCFGAEIYNPDYMTPVIKMELYKPLTIAAERKLTPISKRFYQSCIMTLHNLLYEKKRREAIKRVDYFSPVLPIEYDIMKNQCSYFRAKPFMLGCGPSSIREIPLVVKENVGNVLVGNSCSYTNNHIDIFASLLKHDISDSRKYIFPVSYGWAYGSANNLKSLCPLDESKCIWLDSYMPYDEYTQLFNSVTHAVFGIMRQQSIGNVALCLRKGIKVFLYKDSLVYKYFKQAGYAVFSIEDDLNEENLNSTLSLQDSKTNRELSIKRYSCAYPENVINEFLSIFDKVPC